VAVPVYRGGAQVGKATSTTWSPVLKKMIALATVMAVLLNSPLLKVEAACTRCHKDQKPDELRARVEAEQDRFFRQRNVAMDALMGLIGEKVSAPFLDLIARSLAFAETTDGAVDPTPQRFSVTLALSE